MRKRKNTGYNQLFVPPRLPRYDRRKHDLEDAARLDRTIDEADEKPHDLGGRATGSRRDLRGVPVIGKGIGGTSPGTNPATAVLRLDGRRR